MFTLSECWEMGFGPYGQLPWPVSELALSLDRKNCSSASAVSQGVGGPFLETLCAASYHSFAPLQMTSKFFCGSLLCVIWRIKQAGEQERWCHSLFLRSSPFLLLTGFWDFFFFFKVEMVWGTGLFAQPWVIDWLVTISSFSLEVTMYQLWWVRINYWYPRC